MSTLRSLCVLGLVLSAGSAFCQQVGTYMGTTSQAGGSVIFTVEDDGTGRPVFTGGTVFWTANCRKSGPGRFVAWSFGSRQYTLDGRIASETLDNWLYLKLDMRFDPLGDSVSGTVLARTPEFVDISHSSTQVELCESGRVRFTASRVSQSVVAPLAPGRVQRLPR